MSWHLLKFAVEVYTALYLSETKKKEETSKIDYRKEHQGSIETELELHH